MLKQITDYERRIVEEERLARQALTPDISAAHHQVAMLYRTELSILQRKIDMSGTRSEPRPTCDARLT